MTSGLVERHIAFLEALRGAGLAVSLAEDLDAVAALSVLPWDQRTTVKDAYAATLLKRQSLRPTFDALFDVYFPQLVGEGAQPRPDRRGRRLDRPGARQRAGARRVPRPPGAGAGRRRPGGAGAARGRDGRPVRRDAGPRSGAVELVGVHRPAAGLTRRARRPDRRRRCSPRGGPRRRPTRVAGRRVGGFTRRVEDDARRRIAEEKGPDHVADVAVRPSIDRLEVHGRAQGGPRGDAPEIYPLARRLATRLTQEHHARRRGPLDFRGYGPRLDLHRRRAAHDPPPPQAPAPQRARRALRRERLGGQLRAVHAAAGLCPA